MIEEKYSKTLRNIIEFMWKNYEISITISNEIGNNINILGRYSSAHIESRKILKNINVDLTNIKLAVSKDNIEQGKLFVMLHEVGHFFLDKSGYIQKEEYADLLACLLAKKILDENEFKKFLKSNWSQLIPDQIFKIEDEYKNELIEISNLFLYKYTKYLKSKGEL